jgi:hypothetical protein
VNGVQLGLRTISKQVHCMQQSGVAKIRIIEAHDD